MHWVKTPVIVVTITAILTGCAQTPPPPQQAKAPTPGKRVSPAAVEAPTLPAGSFDQAKEHAELAAAQVARMAGRTAEARAAAEAATEHWPGDVAAWAELETDCRAAGDTACAQYAAFFDAKVEFVANLPPHAAVLGFQNIAEEPVGTKVSGMTYDQKTVDTARRLWAFYNVQDPMAGRRDEPMAETFSDKYPYGPALLAAGIGAAVLTGVKAAASK